MLQCHRLVTATLIRPIVWELPYPTGSAIKKKRKEKRKEKKENKREGKERKEGRGREGKGGEGNEREGKGREEKREKRKEKESFDLSLGNLVFLNIHENCS